MIFILNSKGRAKTPDEGRDVNSKNALIRPIFDEHHRGKRSIAQPPDHGGIGNFTAIRMSRKEMAVIRDESVNPIAQRSGNQTRHRAKPPPAAESAGKFDQCIAVGEHTGIRLAQQHHGTTGLGSVVGVTFFSGELALQGCEGNPLAGVIPCDAPDGSGTERAITVEKQNPTHAGRVSRGVDLSSDKITTGPGDAAWFKHPPDLGSPHTPAANRGNSTC